MLFTTKLLRYAFVNVNIHLFSNNGTEHVQSITYGGVEFSGEESKCFFFFRKNKSNIFTESEMRVYKVIQCRNARENQM